MPAQALVVAPPVSIERNRIHHAGRRDAEALPAAAAEVLNGRRKVRAR